jgi:hypothetical protein
MPDRCDRRHAAFARVAAWPLRTMQRSGATPDDARNRR